jgi:ferredoxin
MSHKKQGYRFENDWSLEELNESVKEVYSKGETIPINVKFQFEHRVLSFDDVKQYLIESSTISLLDCFCRTEKGNCDRPVQNCIALNGKAENIVASKDDLESWPGNLNPREVDVEEALLVLKQSHEAGLVHMAYTQKKDKRPDDVDYICSCCSCYCGPLSGVIRFGIAPWLTSYSTSVTDLSKCNSCGICEERCQFGAQEMVNGSLAFNPDLCFGCGLCVSTCPTNAIILVNK